MTRWFTELRPIAAGLIFAVALRVLLVEPFTIPSPSMEPNLLVGDYVVATKFSYGWSRHSLPIAPARLKGRLFGRAPERGDVVIFRLPSDPRTTYVKRVIGLPGDAVQLVAGAVYVNGRALPRTRIGWTEWREQARPDGPAYVTLDTARTAGDDTPVLRVPEGAYLVLGDNRDNSADSRWSEPPAVGFVPAENLVGKARLVLASWRPGASLLRPWTWPRLRWGRFPHPV